MQILKCSYCQEEKSALDFSRQKTNPSKFYAWCNVCRGKNRPVREKRHNLSSEYTEMRAKAVQLRKFNDTQAAELLRQHETGKVPVKTLAEQHKVAQDTIRKTIRRARGNNDS